LARELVNHRRIRHPHVIKFKKAVLTPTHIAIIMEYAGGGEVFSLVLQRGRLTELEARYLFQQARSVSLLQKRLPALLL